jgi:hypothetical protein
MASRNLFARLSDVFAPALAPGVPGNEGRHAFGLPTGDDVRRHDRAGEASVPDGIEGVRHIHVANVEVGPVGALLAREIARIRRALRIGEVEAVAAAAALIEDLGRAAHGRLLVGDLDATPAGGTTDKNGHER